MSVDLVYYSFAAQKKADQLLLEAAVVSSATEGISDTDFYQSMIKPVRRNQSVEAERYNSNRALDILRPFEEAGEMRVDLHGLEGTLLSSALGAGEV
jgi:hypothetical protein